MGKNLQHQDTGISIASTHPGCMWRMLHVLNNHRWRHVTKKMLPHKRHGAGRHAMGIGHPGKNMNATNTGEMQETVDAEMEIPLIEGRATEPTPVNKSSMKSRIKALIAVEISKRRGRHRRSSSYPIRMQLTRTNSIHHLEASDFNHLAQVASNDASPRIVHQDDENSSAAMNPLQSKACEEPVTSNKKCELCASLLTVNSVGHSHVGEHGKQSIQNGTVLQEKLNESAQNLTNVKESNIDVSFNESQQFLDVLDIFSTNKELFLKVLQDPSSPLAHSFHGRRGFNSMTGFSKSMSFPLAGLSGKSGSGPSKLKHEQESSAKGEEKTQIGSQVQKSAELESTEDISESSVPVTVESRIDGVPKPYMAMPETLDSSSTGSPPGLKNQPENKVFIKRFKNLKQKIKHAIRESRKERHRISMDAILHKIPYGRKSEDVKKEIVDLWKETVSDKCSKSSSQSSCENDGKGGPRHIRRTSSFDESLERYRQLYESSFNTEAKHQVPERLKLRTEEMPSISETAPKAFGRILSLPDLSSYFYLQSEEFLDANSSELPISTDVNSNVGIVSSRFNERKTSGLPVGSENQTLLDAPVESGNQNSSVELGELNTVAKDEVGSRSLANEEALDDLGSLTTKEIDAQHENEIQATISPAGKLAEPIPISVLDSSQEDITSPTKFSLSEDSRLKQRSLFSDEAESLYSSVNQQHEASTDSSILTESNINLEKIETSIEQLNSEFLRVLVNTKYVAEFNYVKYVLELSGFSRNELLGTWNSPDQPVDSSVFEEVEGCLLPEPDYPENEEAGNCHHLRLFDLINEVLLDIYERSFSYCPVPLTSTSLFRPVPVGYHVLEEVWGNISWYLSSKPEVDHQSLDNAVCRDLAKGDGWMNLQFEAECVGLELEDMIFDDLLEELGVELLAAASHRHLAYT